MSAEYITSLETQWAAENKKRQTPKITYQEGQALKAIAESDLVEMGDIFKSIQNLLFTQREDYFLVNPQEPKREQGFKILCEHQRADVFSEAAYLLACYGHHIVKPLLSACDMVPPRASNI